MDPYLERAKAAIVRRVGEAFRSDVMELADLDFCWKEDADKGAFVLTVQRGSWQRQLQFLDADVVTCLAVPQALGKYVVAIEDVAAWFQRKRKSDPDPHAATSRT